MGRNMVAVALLLVSLRDMKLLETNNTSDTCKRLISQPRQTERWRLAIDSLTKWRAIPERGSLPLSGGPLPSSGVPVRAACPSSAVSSGSSLIVGDSETQEQEPS